MGVLENAVFERAHNEICPFGQEKSLRGEIFALQTWANFISRRAKRDISQRSAERYFTFCDSKTFHFTIGK